MPSTRKTEAIWIDARARWQINVQANGKRKTFTSTNPGKRGKLEAERKADEWLEGGQKDNPRFDAVWSSFLESTKASTSTANYTQREYFGRIWILPRLEKKKLGDVTLQDMQDVITAAANAGRASKTCKGIRGTFTAFYSYARRNRYIMERPDALTIPQSAPVKERSILQPEDIKTLFSVDHITKYGKQITSHYIHAWRFAILTGMRPGEIYGLQKSDIQGETVTINRSHNVQNEITTGKNKNARRWYVLPKQALAVLEDQQRMLKRLGLISAWVFPDESGDITQQRHAITAWKTYSKQHGIHASPYEMRHTMVSAMDVYVPEKLLKMVVGHSKSMDTRGVYSHEITGEKERAAALISEAFDAILK